MNQKFCKLLLTLLLLCSRSFAQVLTLDPSIHQIGVKANGDHISHLVSITGEHEYPLPFVLLNLALPDWVPPRDKVYFDTQVGSGESRYEVIDTNVSKEVQKEDEEFWSVPVVQVPGFRVLSIGEGRSPLVPWLNSKDGMKGYGVDIWYGNDSIPQEGSNWELLKNYREKFNGADPKDPRLIQAYASTLEHLPKDTQGNEIKFDLIVAHYLLPYLEEKDQISMLRRCAQLLNPGGTIRMNRAEVFLDLKKLAEILGTREKKIIIKSLQDDFPQEVLRMKNGRGVSFLRDFAAESGLEYTVLSTVSNVQIKNTDFFDFKGVLDFLSKVFPYTDATYKETAMQKAILAAGETPKTFADSVNDILANRMKQYILVLRKPLPRE